MTIGYFLNLIISFDANNADAYWAICLMKIEATSEANVGNAKKLLRDVPEFNKYLTLVDSKRQTECVALSKKQTQDTEAKIQAAEKQLASSSKILKFFVGFFILGLLEIPMCIALDMGGFVVVAVLVALLFGFLTFVCIKSDRKTKKEIKRLKETLNSASHKR